MKLKIFLFAILGEFLKLFYKIKMFTPFNGINELNDRREKVVVSLTSYGRRVTKILPYTIISLLRQTYKPDVILLWLDWNHWNDNNLPKSLKHLQQYGLTVCYCEDFKSYKKLIPTLNKYPNDIIITCDDDVFYKKDMIEKLVLAYQEDPSCVYSHRAHKITFSEKGFLKPYNDWNMDVSGMKDRLIFPTGVGGCLYKRSLLYSDICREDLFMKLAPAADDIWFYFMEFMQKTKCVVLPHKGYSFIFLDVFYQYFHKEASLSNSNCKESQNDIQIRKVMEYYHLNDCDLQGLS